VIFVANGHIYLFLIEIVTLLEKKN